MNFLLQFTPDQFAQKNLSIQDILSSGGMVVLTGMLTVFSVLAMLWLTLVIFKFFFHDVKNKTKKTKVVTPEVAPTVSVAPVSHDEELVAVIAAAIAMAESESGNGTKFRVVSFKRK